MLSTLKFPNVKPSGPIAGAELEDMSSGGTFKSAAKARSRFTSSFLANSAKARSEGNEGLRSRDYRISSEPKFDAVRSLDTARFRAT